MAKKKSRAKVVTPPSAILKAQTVDDLRVAFRALKPADRSKFSEAISDVTNRVAGA